MDIAALLSDYWASFGAFVAFGALHSLGAQDGVKRWLGAATSPFFVEHFWRLVYCVVSYAALYHVISALHWGRNPHGDLWLIDYPHWLWRAMLCLHALSIAMLYISFLQSDYLEFWGVKQAWRGFASLCGRGAAAPAMRLFGTDRLVVTGLYAWVRHPMLAGGLLFLLTSGPSRNNLVFLGMYLLYMLAGAYYEERRLLRTFGDRYEHYRRAVGAFFPRFA